MKKLLKITEIATLLKSAVSKLSKIKSLIKDSSLIKIGEKNFFLLRLWCILCQRFRFSENHISDFFSKKKKCIKKKLYIYIFSSKFFFFFIESSETHFHSQNYFFHQKVLTGKFKKNQKMVFAHAPEYCYCTSF